MKRALFVIAFALTSLIAFSQQRDSAACNAMHQGKFKYLDIEDETAYFEIKGSKHVEYHQNGKYYIKSDLKWLSPCTYEMVMTENTIPDFPFQPGAVMVVTVLRKKGDVIEYVSEVKGVKIEGKVRKME